MKAKNILVLVLISIAITSIIIYKNKNFYKDFSDSKISVKDNDSGIEWQDYKKGMKLAKLIENQNKRIFLYFYADWCQYCLKLNETTFKEQAILDYLKENFISILIDTDKEKKLVKDWQVRGLPTMYFLKSDGTSLKTIRGYIGSKKFLKTLQEVVK